MPLGEATIDVPIKGDAVFEGDETVVVRLSGAYAATLGTTEATGTIRDDDAAPVVTPTATPRRRSGRRRRRSPAPHTPAPTHATRAAPAPAPQTAVARPARGQAVREPARASASRSRPRAARRPADRRGLVNNKQVKSLTGKKVTAPVDLRGLPKGQFTVKVTMTTTSGKTLVQTRRYKTCAPKKKG